MKDQKIVATAVLFCLMAVSAPVAFAQEDAEEPATPSINPIEIYACSFNEGQTMDDLMRVTADWNAWMDAEGQDDYWAVTLMPLYHSTEIDFDIAWVGGWPDGATMAAGTEFWITKGGEHQKAYERVVDCDEHVNFAVLDVQPYSFQTGPVEFSNCTVKEGKSFPDALAAVNQWVAYQGENGIVQGHFLLFPAFGESSDADYSFKWVTVSSYETFGRAYDQFGTGGGWRKSQELFGEVLDCDSSRVYHGTPVRGLELGE